MDDQLISDAELERLRDNLLKKNQDFRDDLFRIGQEDEDERKLIIKACEMDFLFFVNAFGWIKQESPVPADLPFITWPKQNEGAQVVVELRRQVESDPKKITRGDFWCGKCREVGASWLFCVYQQLWEVMFTDGLTNLSGSRRAEDVDKPGASKSTFWKIEYAIDHLPLWMIPAGYYVKKYLPEKRIPNKLFNIERKISIPAKGTILGETTQENFGRQGRYGKVDLDEFGHADDGQPGMGEYIWTSCQATTKRRNAISTPNGEGNKFASLRHVPESREFRKFEISWWDDPVKARGKYWVEEGLPWAPCWWSNWAEAERKAMDNDALFGQEYMLSFSGVGGSYYGDMRIAQIRTTQIKHPLHRGNVILNENKRIQEIVLDNKGFLKVWHSDLPPKPGRYVCGIDIAQGNQDEGGKGASNSCIAIGLITGKDRVVKVAQYTVAGLLAHKFAALAVPICYYYCSPAGYPAFMVPEANGPGEAFIGTVINDLHFPNCYYRTNKDGSGGFGFYTQMKKVADQWTGSRKWLFDTHKEWLATGQYEEPCEETLMEMEQYKTTPEGGAEHVRSKSVLDASQARDNHGDTVIATALMIWGAKYLGEQPEQGTVANAPLFSIQWAKDRQRQSVRGLFR